MQAKFSYTEITKLKNKTKHGYVFSSVGAVLISNLAWSKGPSKCGPLKRTGLSTGLNSGVEPEPGIHVGTVPEFQSMQKCRTVPFCVPAFLGKSL